MSTTFNNPNGPPPKFPLSTLNPGPETQEDWQSFMRWLLFQWKNNQAVQQQVQANQTLPPPAPVPYPVIQPTPRYITFVFDALGPSLQTSNLRIQLPATTSPLALDISAVSAPVAAAALFDIQTSPDLVHWTSILQAPASLPAGALQAPTLHAFAPGALLIPGYWIRAVPTAASDLTALQVALELMVA